ncbi:ABC transporter ATP-binding protein [Populibacterium corticicola]|uniref:ABC transporter ATP-binding protein n=1 Tax=Populibacterium corticicola TaxID=1812826 RepID=A0ABW5XE42_9MICO
MTKEHSLIGRDLSLGYGNTVIVNNLDLDIPSGAITSIIGPNGCGKSTLLRGFARLLKPFTGEVHLDGKDIRSIPTKQVAQVVGLLPQQPIAPEGIAVADLVGRGRQPHQKLLARWTAHDYEIVAQALQDTGISELADRSVDELSGGQRQRVWIAMALAQETDILLLDEPTTFLDLTHQIEILDLLTDLNRARGTTIVMVMHDMNLAARYSHHIIALRGGTLVAQGTPEQVITEELVHDVFALPAQVTQDPVSQTPLVSPRGRHHVRGSQLGDPVQPTGDSIPLTSESSSNAR